MGNRFVLVKINECYAIINKSEIKSGDFMADKNGIYEAPEIDGFIGFSKVLACSLSKGNLPLIDARQIFIPSSMKSDEYWIARLELDEKESFKLRNGFVNLIGIEVPKLL